MRSSRYRRYLEYKNYVKRIKKGLILTIIIFLIMVLVVEINKQRILPHDQYIFKVLSSYENINLKFFDGEFSVKISKRLLNSFFKRTNFVIFKSKGYLFSLVGNN